MSIDEMREKIIPIAKEYGVPKVPVFGSVARGENTKNSNVDILIYHGQK